MINSLEKGRGVRIGCFDTSFQLSGEPSCVCKYVLLELKPILHSFLAEKEDSGAFLLLHDNYNFKVKMKV
jgi:hypothetical protein